MYMYYLKRQHVDTQVSKIPLGSVFFMCSRGMCFWLSVTVTGVFLLQVCNEYQKRQETTSTKICQNLASEARKAADFDRNNVSDAGLPVYRKPYKILQALQRFTLHRKSLISRITMHYYVADRLTWSGNVSDVTK